MVHIVIWARVVTQSAQCAVRGPRKKRLQRRGSAQEEEGLAARALPSASSQ